MANKRDRGKRYIRTKQLFDMSADELWQTDRMGPSLPRKWSILDWKGTCEKKVVSSPACIDIPCFYFRVVWNFYWLSTLGLTVSALWSDRGDNGSVNQQLQLLLNSRAEVLRSFTKQRPASSAQSGVRRNWFSSSEWCISVINRSRILICKWSSKLL